MVCRHCGEMNEPGSKFCEACGAPMDSSGQPVAAAGRGRLSTRGFVALLVAIAVAVALIVAGTGFVMYRIGQSGAHTAQVAEDASARDDASKGKNSGAQSDANQDANHDSSQSTSNQSSQSSKSPSTKHDSNASGTDTHADKGTTGQGTVSTAPKTYVNERFQFQIDIPGGFTWGSESANGDGCSFTNNGVTILAYGQHNALFHSPQDELDFMKENLDSSASISFEQVSGDNIYLSYELNGAIFYIKEKVTDDYICAAQLTYPTSERSVGDPLTESVPPTLKFTGAEPRG